MSSDSDAAGARQVDRRKLLQLAGASVSTGLAGCGSNDEGSPGGNENNDEGSPGGSGNNLGEKVEAFELVYFTDWDITPYFESIAPIVKQNIENTLGVKVKLVPQTTGTLVEEILEDSRDTYGSMGHQGLTADRLDPHELVIRFAAHWAGGNGLFNQCQYANCEYTNYAVAQRLARNQEDRQEYVTNAFKAMSEDMPIIPLLQSTAFGAANTDQIDLNGVGTAGIVNFNPSVFLKSSPKGGNKIRSHGPPVMTERTNHLNFAVGAQFYHFLFNSPLVQYNEELELEPMLARDYSVTDDGKKIVFELREGTLHNGEPLTAEDVKFTFDFLHETADLWYQAEEWPRESIEIVDERTVQFNLTRPFPALLTRTLPRWGVLAKTAWEEAANMSDPTGFEPDPDNYVGTGPFKLVGFERGNFLDGEPHDGHPFYNIDHGIILRTYDETVTRVNDFNRGDLDLLTDLTLDSRNNVKEEMGDSVTISTTDGWTTTALYPQTQYGPQKFKPFRQAIAACLNRQKMNQVGYAGESTSLLYGLPISPNHPFYPPEEELTKMVDDPSGDTEKARHILEDAGWGWDDNGNLHYPADADLSPLWPEGGTPDPSEYDCIDENGEFTPTIDLDVFDEL